jgi:hypothetical protein
VVKALSAREESKVRVVLGRRARGHAGSIGLVLEDEQAAVGEPVLPGDLQMPHAGQI